MVDGRRNSQALHDHFALIPTFIITLKNLDDFLTPILIGFTQLLTHSKLDNSI